MQYRSPSYKAGFASPQRGDMAYPQLWRGCVGAWCPSLGQSGSVLRDWSSYRNHGVLTSMDPATDWVASNGKVALDFNGASEYVSIPPILISYPFTFSCWFNAKNVTSTYTLIGVSDSTVDTKYYILQIDGAAAGDPVKFTARNAGASNAAATTTGYSANVWHHAVGIGYSATNREVYLNGGGVGVNTTSTTIGTIDTTSIGALVRLTPQYCLARIDDVRIYNRALSPSEIQTLAQRRGIAYETRRVPIVRGAGGGGGGVVIPVFRHHYQQQGAA